MYYEYWGLNKPPFDNVPDPSMYVDCHGSPENAVTETLFAVREGNECIVVIYGEAGVGKTLSMRKVIDLLDPDKYRTAFIANPGIQFLQMLREIIIQLTGEPCELKKKADLLAKLNRIIFQNHDEGRKVLIFLDEANSLSPLSMESLRLLTNIQKDERNPFTIVLAGTNGLARRLEHPRRENLFQRVGVCCRLEKIPSRDDARKYIDARLRLAGANREIFTPGAYDAIWEHSGSGVPRLINKMAKLCLKTGEACGLEMVTGEIVEQVALRFARAGEPVLPQRRARHEAADDDSSRSALPENVPGPESAGACHDEAEAKPDPDGETGTGCPPGPGMMIDFEGCPILVDLTPVQLMDAKTSGKEVRLKIAGAAAAQVMKAVPVLGTSLKSDPIAVWSSLRDRIFKKMESEFGSSDDSGDRE